MLADLGINGFFLGHMYQKGEGVEKVNVVRAISLFRQFVNVLPPYWNKWDIFNEQSRKAASPQEEAAISYHYFAARIKDAPNSALLIELFNKIAKETPEQFDAQLLMETEFSLKEVLSILDKSVKEEVIGRLHRHFFIVREILKNKIPEVAIDIALSFMAATKLQINHNQAIGIRKRIDYATKSPRNHLFFSSKLFQKMENIFLEENRHNDPKIGRAYDRRFGLTKKCIG